MKSETADHTPAIDRSMVGELLARLESVEYRTEGRVYVIFETPRPGEHVEKDRVLAVPGKGFEGDHEQKSYYRGRLVRGREVSSMNLEVIRVLNVDPSVVGDNMFVSGLDLATLEAGDRIAVGEEVILQRSDYEHRPCATFRERTSPEAFAAVSRKRFRGTLFVVAKGGYITAGDRISVLGRQ